jgi:hypothetical protein
VLDTDTEKSAPLAEEPKEVPAESTVYQLIVLPTEIAFNNEVPETQTSVGVAVTGVGAAGEAPATVTVTGVLVADSQPKTLSQVIVTKPSPERTPEVLL